jgi:hypothetical protein
MRAGAERRERGRERDEREKRDLLGSLGGQQPCQYRGQTELELQKKGRGWGYLEGYIP